MKQLSPFTVAGKPISSWRVSSFVQVLFFVSLIATSVAFFRVDARLYAQSQQPAGEKPAPKKRFRLRVTKGVITAVSLKADRARMTEIAADLAKRLETQVILGQSLKKAALTVEFYDLPLESALRLLASRVYIDYEIRAKVPPKTLGIFLLGDGDPDPAASAIVQGSSQALMMEGNTEDVTEQSDVKDADDPLRVELDDNQLTVKAKKQPLVAIVLTVAEVLSVPAEIRFNSEEIVDTEIKEVPFEDAVTRLSPNVRLYVRADLNRSQRTPLRLVLVSPEVKVADSQTSQ